MAGLPPAFQHLFGAQPENPLLPTNHLTATNGGPSAVAQGFPATHGGDPNAAAQAMPAAMLASSTQGANGVVPQGATAFHAQLGRGPHLAHGTTIGVGGVPGFAPLNQGIPPAAAGGVGMVPPIQAPMGGLPPPGLNPVALPPGANQGLQLPIPMGLQPYNCHTSFATFYADVSKDPFSTNHGEVLSRFDATSNNSQAGDTLL
jgi:hypothetical protein